MDYSFIYKKTVTDLKQIAKREGVKLPSGANKNAILSLLAAHYEQENAKAAEAAKAAAAAKAEPAAPAEAKEAQKQPDKPGKKQPARRQERTAAKKTAAAEEKKTSEPEAAAETGKRSPVIVKPEPVKRPPVTAKLEPAKKPPVVAVESKPEPAKQPPVIKAETKPEPAKKPSVIVPEAKPEPAKELPAAEPDVKPAVNELLQSDTCGDGSGVLEILPDGYGFLRNENCLSGNNDVYVSIPQIRRFGLRNGDFLTGKTRPQREGDRSEAMIYINTVNGRRADAARRRPYFENLTPVFPDFRLKMENDGEPTELSLRVIDMVAPIGKGQRGLIVSPPKAGKTMLLKQIANAITSHYPEIKLIVLLIDERPEEVTDMKRSIQGEVLYSTFDEEPEHHTKLSEMALDYAMRQVEMGDDVVILMDSITRLARAYNMVIPPTGRSLSGGLDPAALYKPKKFFGAARNIENGGSLTIIATALVDTGSRMDDVIYEEFKGTGNMELHLDRKLSERRIFPAIDLNRSGTRRDELLYTPEEADGALTLRRSLGLYQQEGGERLLALMQKTENNAEFVQRLKANIAALRKGTGK